MSDQTSIFDILGTPENPSNPIEARFWDFHKENPHVYALFDRFTRQAARNRERIAVSLIIERIRWESMIATTGDEWKINNDYRAYYARLFMRDNPQYRGLFSTRRLLAGEESSALKPGVAA